MNHIYKTVWNAAMGTWTAVQETAKSHGKSSSSKAGHAGEQTVGVRFAFTLMASALLLASGQVMAVTGTDSAGKQVCFYDAASQSVVCGDAATKTEDTYQTKTAKSVVIGKEATNNGESNVAIGVKSASAETASVAIGSEAKALHNQSVAIGQNAEANSDWDISIGRFAGRGTKNPEAEGRNIAIGDGALRDATNPNNTTAIGTSAGAGSTGDFNVVIGTYANSTTAQAGGVAASNVVAIGDRALATSNSAVAIGNRVKASGAIATAVGASADASGAYSISNGYGATSSGSHSIAIGSSQNQANKTQATQNYAIAIGSNQTAATGNSAIAVGTESKASGGKAIAVGAAAKAQVEDSIAIGRGVTTELLAGDGVGNREGMIAIGSERTKASGKAAVAIGRNSQGIGRGTVALGDDAQSTTGQAIAVGAGVRSSAAGSVSIGSASKSSADRAVSLGVESNSTAYRSVALGAQSEADRAALTGVTTSDAATAGANEVYAQAQAKPADKTAVSATVKGTLGAVSVGNATNTRQIINVAAGSEDTDAVNVAQLKAVANQATHYYSVKDEAGDSALADGNYNNDGATGSRSLAAGIGSRATANNATAVGGKHAKATAVQALALGADTLASGNSSIAIGGDDLDHLKQTTRDYYNTLTGGGTINVGTYTDTTANADASIALGVQTQATGDLSMALGTKAEADGVAATAVGSGAKGHGEASLALGAGAVTQAKGVASVALGTRAQTDAAAALALGTLANVDKEGAVALGAGSTTATNATQETTATVGGITYSGFAGAANVKVGDQISVGKAGLERQIKHVAPGAISPTSTDAINGSQLHATQTAVGKLASSTAAHLGGGAAVRADGSISEPAYTINGTTYNNVGAALQAAANSGGAGGGTHYYSVNSGDRAADSNYNNTGATGSDALAAGMKASASGRQATAVGSEVTASGNQSLAVGNNATARGTGATSVGNNTRATADGSQVFGQSSRSEAKDAVALGRFSVADVGAERATVVGVANDASGTSSVSIGDRSHANKENAIAIGKGAQAGTTNAVTTTDADTIAIGTNATAYEKDTVALGNGAQATADSGTALGKGTRATASYATAIGLDAHATGGSAVALGSGAQSTAQSATALGNDAKAGVNDSVAVGKDAKTTGTGSGAVAVGRNAHADGQGSTAVGINARSANQSIAIGTNANNPAGAPGAIGASSVAIGNNTNAAGENTVALGNQSTATGSKATALGFDAQAQGQSSVVIGDSARNARATGNASHPSADQAVVVGVSSNVNSLGGIAIGSTTQTTGVYGTAVGIGSQNNADFGVALGALSTTDSAIQVDRAGYAPVASAQAAIDATKANAAGVSVGGKVLSQQGSAPGQTAVRPNGVNDGDIIRRQIHNVAAGTDDTDAVNVAQLKALSGQINQSASHYYSVNDNGTPKGNYNNDGATADRALAAGVDASASALGATAVGNGAIASNIEAVAVGTRANASGTATVAVGEGTKASGTSAIAIGLNTEASGNNSFVLGSGSTDPGVPNSRLAKASGEQAIAVGYRTQSLGTNATAVGANATAGALNATALGTSATASGATSLAVGSAANATGASSVAVGRISKSHTGNDIAIGSEAEAGVVNGGTSSNAIAVGLRAKSAQANTVAVGADAQATASGAMAQGNGAQASGKDSVAHGKASRATGDFATAVGNSANAGKHAAAVGNGATATGEYAAAFGTGSAAVKDGAAALGNDAKANEWASVAVGRDAQATQIASVAIGESARATHEGAVALGKESETAAAVGTNQATVGNITYGGFAGTAPTSTVSVGKTGAERTITNVAAGRISATSTDAINGSQLHATQTVIGNVAGSVKNILGGDARVDADGTLNMTDIGGTGQSTIHDAIKAAATATKVTSNDKSVTVTPDAANNAYDLAVNTDNATIVKDANGALKANTTALVALPAGQPNAGQVTLPVGDENKLATAGDIVGAINNSGFTLTAAGANGSLVKPGATVDLKNTDGNIVVSKAAGDNNVNFDLAPTVKVGPANGGSPITINGTAGSISGLSGNLPATTSTGATPTTNQAAPANPATGNAATVGDVLNAGWNLQGNGAAKDFVRPYDTVNFVNGKGTTVTVDSNGATSTIKVDVDVTQQLQASSPFAYVNGAGDILTRTVDANGAVVFLDESGTPYVGNDISISALYPGGGGRTAQATTVGNVAPGKAPNDAVNVSQLEGVAKALGGGAGIDPATGNFTAPSYVITKTDGSSYAPATNVGQALKNLNDEVVKPLTFVGDASIVSGVANKVDRKLGDTLNIIGKTTDSKPAPHPDDFSADNIGVFAAGTNLVVRLAKRVDLGSTGSVKAGNTTVNNDGIAIANAADPAKNVSLSGSGLNNGGNKITNVAAGTDPNDAVNFGQLKDLQDSVAGGWNIGNGGAAPVGSVKPGKQVDFVAGNSSTKVDVTQDAATGNSKVTVSAAPGALQYTDTNTAAGGNAPKADPFTPADQVTLVGAGGNTSSGVTINNVAPAELSPASKQAVNGSQLHAVGDSTAKALGGTSAFDPATGKVTAGLDVGGNTYTNVQDALRAINTTASGGWNLRANGGPISNIAGPNNTVNVINGSNTKVTLTGNDLKVDVVDNPTFSGPVTANGGLTAAGNLTAAPGTNVSMGGNAIHNVAPGVADTDAVNVKQLRDATGNIGNIANELKNVNNKVDAVDARVTQVDNRVTQVDNRVTNLSNRVDGIDGKIKDADKRVTDVANLLGENLTNPDGTKGLTVYDVAGQTRTEHTNVISALNQIKNEGTKYSHTRDNGEAPIIGPTNDASAGALGSTAQGVNAIVEEDAVNATAVGRRARVRRAAAGAVAVGNEATAGAASAVAVGDAAKALGERSIAIGKNNEVHSRQAGAMGDSNTLNVGAGNSYAVGNGNTVNTDNSFVVGNNVVTSVANSVYLGAGAAATAAPTAQSAGMASYNASVVDGVTHQYAGGTPVGVVSVGDVGQERRVQNVAAGLVSPTSTDAINGSQLYQTNAAIGGLNNRINANHDKAMGGIASAMASAGLPQAYLPGKSMIAMGVGAYQGRSAVAVGVSTISDNGRWIIKGSVNANNKGNVGATLGAGYQW